MIRTEALGFLHVSGRDDDARARARPCCFAATSTSVASTRPLPDANPRVHGSVQPCQLPFLISSTGPRGKKIASRPRFGWASAGSTPLMIGVRVEQSELRTAPPTGRYFKEILSRYAKNKSSSISTSCKARASRALKFAISPGREMALAGSVRLKTLRCVISRSTFLKNASLPTSSSGSMASARFPQFSLLGSSARHPPVRAFERISTTNARPELFGPRSNVLNAPASRMALGD